MDKIIENAEAIRRITIIDSAKTNSPSQRIFSKIPAITKNGNSEAEINQPTHNPHYVVVEDLILHKGKGLFA